MAKKLKLSKLDVDVNFLDPVTFEKICSFNQCIEKFEPGSEVVEHTNHVGIFLIENYFHKCGECGRKIQSKQDKKKKIYSILDSVCSSRFAPGYEREEKT